MPKFDKHMAGMENLLKKVLKHTMEGHLFTPEDATEKKWAEHLVERGLLRKNGPVYELTDSGRKEARAVVRKHRLFETYLAKKTGFPVKEWHALAEKKEHSIDEETLNKWEKELGFPLVDPHGDPIPDATGEMAHIETRLLNEVKPQKETFFKIIHLEDEPETPYHNLIDKGLYPGLILKIKYEKEQWHLTFEGLQVELPEEEAGLISVIELEEKPDFFHAVRLSSLDEGEKAKIIGLSDALHGLTRQRLLDLGFVRNAVVSVYMKAPFGEPAAYDIKGATVALRKEQADKILVEKL